jgi:hypothetical protein
MYPSTLYDHSLRSVLRVMMHHVDAALSQEKSPQAPAIAIVKI